MIRQEAEFNEQLSIVKKKITTDYYLIANKRKKGNIKDVTFNVKINLIGMLEDNKLGDFLTDLEKNTILDKLIWQE
jgi:hypothetical protein